MPYKILYDDGAHKNLLAGDCGLGRGIIPSNQHVISHKGSAIVLDPDGYKLFTRAQKQFLSVIGNHRLVGVFLSHQDPDTVASTRAWLTSTEADLYFPELWIRFFPHFGLDTTTDWQRLHPIPDQGAIIDLNGSELLVFSARLLNNAGSFQIFDPISKVLYIGDLRAILGTDTDEVIDFDAYVKNIEQFHRNCLASGKALRAWVDWASNLDIEILAPRRGPLFEGKAIIRRFMAWCSEFADHMDGIAVSFKVPEPAVNDPIPKTIECRTRAPKQHLFERALSFNTSMPVACEWAPKELGSTEDTLCLHHLFERQARNTPNALAIICGLTQLTYKEVDVKANQLTAQLIKAKATVESLVAIYLERSANSIIAMLAVLKAGAAYVPVDPLYPIERVHHILEDAGVKALITQQSLFENLADTTDCASILLDPHSHEAGQAVSFTSSTPATRSSSNHLCYVIYTSGSTGRPKGVMIEHRSAVHYVRSANEVYGIHRQDRVYQGFSHAFDASVEEIWITLSTGATLVIGTQDIVRSSFDVARLLNKNNISVFSTVPTFLSMMEDDLPSVRLLILGGESCPPDLVNRWARPGRKLLNTYGPTETTVVATCAECVPGKPVTIGRPLRDYSVHVLDEHLKPTPQGESGELYIGGPGVARGYVNRPDLTQERFVPNPFAPDGANGQSRLYRTGDSVCLTDEGQIAFLGRLDGQIKLRGHRVELAEIEAVLLEAPWVQATAVSVFETDGIQRIAAYVTSKEAETQALRSALLELARRRLPVYMVPSYLDWIDTIPLMSSGKVDRRNLPVPVAPLVDTQRAMDAPTTQLETEVAEVCKKLFDNSAISIRDDFFKDLGGHSLLAARFASTLRQQLELPNISVRDIYRFPNIEALASYLELIQQQATEGKTTGSTTTGSSERTLQSVPSLTRWFCVATQALFLVALLCVGSMAASLFSWLIIRTVVGAMEPYVSLIILGVVALVGYPALLLGSIAWKWLVIGRYQPGSYPIWGSYYLRWWLVTQVQNLSSSWLLAGTPLMNLYLRLMGANVGKNCTIDTPILYAFDAIQIGDNTSIGAETHVLGYRMENGMLHIGTVDIGRNCFIGMHSNVGLNTRMDDGARLDDLSQLSDHDVIPANEGRRGSPAERAEIEVPSQRPYRTWTRALYATGHFFGLYAVGIFLFLTAIPGIALTVLAFQKGNIGLGFASLLLSVPLNIMVFCLSIVALKAFLVGRVEPGTYPVESALYIRNWLFDIVLTVSRDWVLPLYATLYFPTWLRLLGAKIGARVEVSTVAHLSPDLLLVGDESFFADAAIVGGKRIFGGSFELTANRIGSRTFVGNSAMVPPGASIGSDCLVGVLSVPPKGYEATEDGTQWLGSPPFKLTRPKDMQGFMDTVLYRPSRRLYAERLAIDAIRVILPALIEATALTAFSLYLYIACLHFPPVGTFLGAPIVAFAILTGTALSVVGIKQSLIPRYTPTVKALWSRYVWANEVINGLYESIAAPILGPLLGTPFVAKYLKLLGCKIGKHVYLGTTLFSEFDLVEIGDHAVLNIGATIQTHLFEDRIMKSSYLKIGKECSIGNMATVLYDTNMGRGSSLAPLSLLMKGESLPEFSRWSGIPSAACPAYGKTSDTCLHNRSGIRPAA
jgi:non-ribosomal peptide synthetase-like protein